MPHSAKFVTTQRLRLSKKLIGARDSGSGEVCATLLMSTYKISRGVTRGGHWGHVPPNFLIGGDRVLNCPPQLLKSDIFLQNINIYKGKI